MAAVEADPVRAVDVHDVVLEADGVEPYGGPRSVIGSALARTVHRAVRTGISLERVGTETGVATSNARPTTMPSDG